MDIVSNQKTDLGIEVSFTKTPGLKFEDKYYNGNLIYPTGLSAGTYDN